MVVRVWSVCGGCACVECVWWLCVCGVRVVVVCVVVVYVRSACGGCVCEECV